MKTTTLETTSTIAGKASMAAGGTTVAISFWSQEFIFAGIGVLITLATFAVNLYYKRRADARAAAKARAEGIIQSRFTFHDLRAYYATRHKAQFGDLPEMHVRRATTEAVYDRSKRSTRRSVD